MEVCISRKTRKLALIINSLSEIYQAQRGLNLSPSHIHIQPQEINTKIRLNIDYQVTFSLVCSVSTERWPKARKGTQLLMKLMMKVWRVGCLPRLVHFRIISLLLLLCKKVTLSARNLVTIYLFLSPLLSQFLSGGRRLTGPREESPWRNLFRISIERENQLSKQMQECYLALDL